MGPGLTGKKSNNWKFFHKIVMIYWVAYHVYFIRIYMLLKVVSHCDLSMLSTLVMGFKKNF